MKRVSPNFVKRAHAYTGDRLPWRTDPDRAVSVQTSTGHRFGWRLFRYLSGGGMYGCGRPNSMEVISRRQSVFLAAVIVLIAVWLVFLFLQLPE